ncbi:AAT-domain-containing protein [Amylocystis lapponica]|nr:AAT-domain-containing protein [Amylocystis lapponica]
MTSYDIPQIKLSGSPYEIGFAHGRKLAAQVVSQLAIYRAIFQETCKFDWPHVLGIAEQFRATIHRLAPDLLEEMRGIADGVGQDGVTVTLLDIVALNSRSEIALGKWDDGCTSLAWELRDPARQILAQNWDWRTDVGENLAMVSIKQAQKPDIWMVTEPGIVGKIGFNSSSVGVCLNAIRASPVSTALLPIHLLLRIALQCDSVERAIATIERLGGAASSQHILAADVRGSRGLELSPRGGVYLSADPDGVLVHTNHFLENTLVDEPPWLSGSPHRLARARALCTDIMRDSLGRAPDAGVLRRRLFSDTTNLPQAICCCPDPERGGLASIETLFNIVMVFAVGTAPSAEVVFGRPGSEKESKVFVLPW